MKKRLSLLLVLFLALNVITGCSNKEGGSELKYLKNTFYNPFDTVFVLNAYATEDDFTKYFNMLEEEMERLHRLYTKYNDYEGINNIKTINDNAGIAPVEVEQEIIDLLKFSIDSAKDISMNVDVSMGAVLETWHAYREENAGKIPTIEELETANQYTDISKVIIDEENKTVYLEDKNMRLDVGATAKGYAAELGKQLLIENGCEAFILSAGGNIVSHGVRIFPNSLNEELNKALPDCETKFCVAITSPGNGAYADKERIATVVIDNDLSVVTSGDYERLYRASDGTDYHHIIDPDTLFPGYFMRSITIITEDSGMADFLSTAIFLESYEVGSLIIESLEGVEAVWLLNDGTIELSSGLVQGENIHIYE